MQASTALLLTSFATHKLGVLIIAAPVTPSQLNQFSEALCEREGKTHFQLQGAINKNYMSSVNKCWIL